MRTVRMTRRHLLAGIAATAAVALPSSGRAAELEAAQIPAQGTHLVLLGTMGGPVLHPARMMNSQAVVVDGTPYLIDCGYGTMERMTRARLAPASLKAIFLTHHHSDHSADYPALIHMAWIQGIKDQLRVLGPPPMRRMHEAALAFNREDTEIRIKATGRKPIEASFDVQELTAPGEVYADDKVKVRAALVDHPPFSKAFAFRFDAADRSIVLSGDTAPSDALVALARGADVLVHETMYGPGIDRMLAERPYVPPTLKQFLMQGHTTAEECGQIAARAQVKTLVLSHLTPGNLGIADEVWRAEAAKHFGGDIIVARDLLVV